jgi:hypothetical protein
MHRPRVPADSYAQHVNDLLVDTVEDAKDLACRGEARVVLPAVQRMRVLALHLAQHADSSTEVSSITY